MTAVTAEVQAQTSGRRFVQQSAVATMLPWLLVPVLARVGFTGSGVGLSVFAVALATPHVATTAWFYLAPSCRSVLDVDRVRSVLVPAVAVPLVVAVLVTAPARVESWLLVGLAGWQLHHFGRQNLGMFAFLCRASGMPGPTDQEREVFRWCGWAGVFGVLPFAAGGLDAARFIAAGFLIAAALIVVRVSPTDPVRFGGLVCAVGFFLPLLVFDDIVSATIGYGAAHGAQYLLMMGHLPTRRGMAGLVALYVLGGWVLVHLHDAGGILAYLLIGVTVAHFLADARLWKMRTPQQRTFYKQRFRFL